MARTGQGLERIFVFARKLGKRFAPAFAKYAVHCFVVLIALLAVWNNLAGKQDQNSGEEREGSCILFSGVLPNNRLYLIEDRGGLDGFVQGIGGFTSKLSATVLAADNSTESGQGEEGGGSLATVQGSALIPLAILESEVEAGPLEEGRKETVEHTVSAGESVSQIAFSYGVSVATILSANNLSETSYIQPGDTLKIPPVSGVLYTVTSGDTLGGIVKKYQGDFEKTQEYNNLDANGSIQIGQVLLIPDGKIPLPSPTQPSSYASRYSETPSASGSQVSKSGWIWPTSSRKINQYYSYRHHGVDIEGNNGSPIYASQGGTIIFAGWRAGYGKSIIVQHPNGTQTLYAHLLGYKRTAGSVGGGELVGYVGTTGWSTGPHLHFEIRTSRGTVNPLNYIR